MFADKKCGILLLKRFAISHKEKGGIKQYEIYQNARMRQ